MTAVESFRFLGTTISQDLKWDNHIDSLAEEVQPVSDSAGPAGRDFSSLTYLSIPTRISERKCVKNKCIRSPH